MIDLNSILTQAEEYADVRDRFIQSNASFSICSEANSLFDLINAAKNYDSPAIIRQLVARVKELTAMIDHDLDYTPILNEHLDTYEYKVTTGGRKTWDGEPDLSKEGWEEDGEWTRLDYHEERHWKRKKNKDLK